MDDADPAGDAWADSVDDQDPATPALNSVRGEATTGLIEMLVSARRSDRDDSATRIGQTLRAQVAADQSRAVRGAIGLRLAALLVSDRGHADEWREMLFGPAATPPARNAAWHAHLLYGTIWKDTLSALAPEYADAVDAFDPHAPGTGPGRGDLDGHLGIHLAAAHLIHLPEEEEGRWLTTFYAKAPDPVRARVTRWLAGEAASAEVPDEIGRRACSFLRLRAANAQGDADRDEMKAMGSVADATAYEVLESIILPALRATGGSTDNGAGVLARAASVAPTQPLLAATILQLLIMGDEWRSLPYLGAADLRRLLGDVMASTDADAHAIAAAVINTLGALGSLEYRDLLPSMSSPGIVASPPSSRDQEIRPMKIRRVSASVLETRTSAPAAESPRQRQRRELEAALQGAIQGANADADAAFLVTLRSDEKLSSVRAAFKRVKERVGATEVNLVTVGASLYIAKVPQRRGRPKAG